MRLDANLELREPERGQGRPAKRDVYRSPLTPRRAPPSTWRAAIAFRRVCDGGHRDTLGLLAKMKTSRVFAYCSGSCTDLPFGSPAGFSTVRAREHEELLLSLQKDRGHGC